MNWKRKPEDRRRFAIPAAAALTALALSATSVSAEPAYCGRIQAEYIAAERAAGSGGNNDVGRARSELARVQAQARQFGCQRFLFFGPKPHRQCPAIMAKMNQLQREVNRAGGFGWGNIGTRRANFERDRLRNQLERNGCSIPSGGSASGGTRTLCVRTCDGYYFPISFSGNQTRFKIDEVVCKAMYGGAEAELFVQGSGAPVESAVSLTGQPYTSLPSAFAFRDRFDKACQAELHTGLANLARAQEARIATLEAEQKAENAANPAVVLLPLPAPRIDAGEDPETLANLAGDFRVEPITPEVEGADAVADASSVRRIGPAYYYQKPVKIEGLVGKPWKAPELTFVGNAEAAEPPERETDEPPTSVQ